MEKINYSFGGLNCAETIIKVFNERNNTNIPVSLGSGLGSGLTTGSVCGAINAGALIIGYLYGRSDISEKNEARAIVNRYMKLFFEEYKSEICIVLKKEKISCKSIVNRAYENLITVLKEYNTQLK